jgi:hypothetical protein
MYVFIMLKFYRKFLIFLRFLKFVQIYITYDMNQNMNILRLNNNHSYQYEALLGVFNANRLLAFPPPIMNPNVMIGLLNNNNANQRNQRNVSVNGCRLLRYFVSLQGRTFSSNIIGLVTSYLWKNANPNEKEDYVNLAEQVKRLSR